MLPEKLSEERKDKEFIFLTLLISCFLPFEAYPRGMNFSVIPDYLMCSHLAVTEKARSLFPQHNTASGSGICE